jgi:hypothetical protein
MDVPDEDFLLVRKLICRLDALKVGLANAREIGDLEQEGTFERANHDRLAAFHALKTIVDFLEAFEDMRKERLTEPLVKLLSALFQVTQGHRAPMLMPADQGNRPPDHTLLATLKGRAAATMTLWMEAGQPKSGAARIVAEALAKCRLKSQSEKFVTKKTVANWRYNVSGAAAPSPAKSAYDKALLIAKSAKAAARLSDEEVARRATASLQTFVQGYGLREI